MKKYFYVFCFICVLTGGIAQTNQIQKLQKLPPSFQRDSLLFVALDEQAVRFITSSTPDSAWSLINSMESLYKKHTWLIGEGLWLYRKGHYYMNIGNAVEATRCFIKALDVFTKLHDIPRVLMVYNFQATNLIYNDYTDSTNLFAAIKLLQKGLDISVKTPEKIKFSVFCYSIGYAYHKMNNHATALAYFQKSSMNIKERGLVEPFGVCLMLATCYALTGDETKSALYLKKCREYRPNLSVQQQYEYNYEIAGIYLFSRNFQLAEKYCLAMLECAKLMKSSAKVIVAERFLYDLYKKTAKTGAALQALERLKHIEDSTLNQRSKAAITELELKYETTAQQRQIDQLNINQQAQTQKVLIVGLFLLIGLVGYVFWNYRKLLQKNKEISTAMLQGQTTERKRIAADLHDNLGSTMSALRWSLGAINKNNLSQREQEVYQHVQNTIEQAYDQVRLLSHNFLPEELEKQGFWVALEELVRKLNKNTPVKFYLQLPENQARLEAKTEFELYSICLELINNILKHAQATEARVVCRVQSAECRMVISDNGKGIFENNASGKGLRNIAERVKSLEGTWEVKSEEGNGVVNEIVVTI